MTGDRACYRSRVFNQALQATGVGHRCTRPYRPQTGAKVERLNPTLQEEQAGVGGFLGCWDQSTTLCEG